MRKHSTWKILVAFVGYILYGGLLEAKSGFIGKGYFETNDLSGWTIFTTSNGTLGEPGFPDSVLFDTNGDGVVTKSLRFKVGQLHYEGKRKSLDGGGIFSTLWVEGGTVFIEADIASAYSSPKDRRNLAGGLFELLLDGQIVAHHDFGPIESGITKRFTLKGESHISAGRHEIRIRIRRPFTSLPGDQAPEQYLDNVRLTLQPS